MTISEFKARLIFIGYKQKSHYYWEKGKISLYINNNIININNKTNKTNKTYKMNSESLTKAYNTIVSSLLHKQ